MSETNPTTRKKQARGMGRVFQQAWTDPRTGTTKYTATWYIEYSVNGKEYRESTGSTKKSVAIALLNQRRGEHATGTALEPQARRTTVDELLWVTRRHYEGPPRLRSFQRGDELAAHLRGFFGGTCRAIDITEVRIDAFVDEHTKRLCDCPVVAADRPVDATDRSLKEMLPLGWPGLKRKPTRPWASATCNRALALLRRAFRLGRKKKLVRDIPNITLLAEDNVRQGFFEPLEFEAVVAHLPPPLQAVAQFGYLSGWRLGEILTLRWADVDREAQEIRLRPEHSKNKAGRVLGLVDTALWALIEQQWAARRVSDPQHPGAVALATHVFHREGQPITDFRGAWQSACEAAHVPGRLFHDLRRTAIRNMVRAGVDPLRAMKITGHKTRNVFDRYNIINVADVADALRQTDAYRTAATEAARARAEAEGPAVVALGAAAQAQPGKYPVRGGRRRGVPP